MATEWASPPRKPTERVECNHRGMLSADNRLPPDKKDFSERERGWLDIWMEVMGISAKDKVGCLR